MRGHSLVSLGAKLTALNALTLFAGLITGPVLARALGASGRGNLAAILVPASLAPLVLGFGLSAFANREAARGRDLSTLGGSLGVLALALGVAGFGLGVPVAGYLADGHDDVQLMLLLFFAVLPITLIAQVVYGTASGLTRYRETTMTRLTSPLILVVALPALALTGKLTVLSAALATLGASLLTLAPLWPVARGMVRPRFSPEVANRGFRFGLRAWAGGLSFAVSARLDQLMMIKLVSTRELGLYAVAVTISAFVSSGTSAVSSLLLPRVARGDTDLLRRTSRVLVLLLTLAAAGMVALVPVALPLLFGDDFSGAMSMAVILLAAAIPYGAATHLGPALTSLGYPGTESAAQVAALAITVLALPFVLPWLGGDGAALVSFVAYSANMLVLLVAARRNVGGSVGSFLIVTRDDLAWLRALAQPIAGRLFTRMQG